MILPFNWSWAQLLANLATSGTEIPLQEKSRKTTPPSLPSYIELGSQHMLSQSYFRKYVEVKYQGNIIFFLIV